MRATDRFVQSGNLVIEVVPTFIKPSAVQGKRILDEVGIDHRHPRSTRSRVALFEQVQEPSRIAIGVANEGVDGQVDKSEMTQRLFLRPYQQLFQFVFGQ